MKKAQIKTSPAAIEKALQDLLSEIEEGNEFPDAAWRIACRHLVDYQALVDAYDEHHA